MAVANEITNDVVRLLSGLHGIDPTGVFDKSARPSKDELFVRQVSIFVLRNMYGLTFGELHRITGISRRNLYKHEAAVRHMIDRYEAVREFMAAVKDKIGIDE